jgi:hypothetical protein
MYHYQSLSSICHSRVFNFSFDKRRLITGSGTYDEHTYVLVTLVTVLHQKQNGVRVLNTEQHPLTRCGNRESSIREGVILTISVVAFKELQERGFFSKKKGSKSKANLKVSGKKQRAEAPTIPTLTCECTVSHRYEQVVGRHSTNARRTIAALIYRNVKSSIPRLSTTFSLRCLLRSRLLRAKSPPFVHRNVRIVQLKFPLECDVLPFGAQNF